ncbi:hypothetical protein H4W29_002098 [Rhizobium viscosum]|uniref:Uncharacterized protein n=1 Tax=Rhizobium viscosum TaxID=1673 RepID=A0ABR9INZ9_RHIVS|nr:hypothetical protein [Rhizobium viscosum]
MSRRDRGGCYRSVICIRFRLGFQQRQGNHVHVAQIIDGGEQFRLSFNRFLLGESFIDIRRRPAGRIHFLGQNRIGRNWQIFVARARLQLPFNGLWHRLFRRLAEGEDLFDETERHELSVKSGRRGSRQLHIEMLAVVA